jgi:single-stranded-DNA-specific exonuclease
MSKNCVDTGYGKPMGKENEHLRLFVKQNHSEGIAAIGFGLGNKLDVVADKKPFTAVYSLDENEWNGNVTVQLRLKDLN